jgi:alginate O-acetyltransferase complex protein AlgI
VTVTEAAFAFFLAAVLVVHWVLPRRPTAQNALLLAASYLFYATWDRRLLTLLIASTAVDFAVGLYLGRGAEAPSRPSTSARRIALAASLACNLGALLYFKYTGFLAESLNALLAVAHLAPSVPVLRLVLPLGISFYTLQKLGYIFDVYYGRQDACRSPLTFATFVAFFPHITAGPISRGAELLPQLDSPRRLTPERLSSGAAAILMGWVLKGYVADTLGPRLVDQVFDKPDAFAVATHWWALLAYEAQVFADFAGYSLIAIGVARLLGLELPTNFNFPFLSRSLPEFWRRWHITLNRWLFDYIYFPLTTGSGGLRGQVNAGFLIVFLASGLWHGARATFLLWGLLHGIGMVVHHQWDEFYRSLCRRDRRFVQWKKSGAYAGASWVLTQGFFALTLVPFRSTTLAGTAAYFRGLVVNASGAAPPQALRIRVMILVGLAIVAAYHINELPALGGVRRRFSDAPAPVRGVVYALVLTFLLLFVPLGAGTVIYRNF